ncbi:HAMP domain-containing sensor histidine kinase [Compostibacter hankyongensis]|uniref:histidine kinase n=1 Tax=Compostibacter hankyongensis TaxID=1007089 RepID=A0ABP8FMT2_9BACT
MTFKGFSWGLFLRVLLLFLTLLGIAFLVVNREWPYAVYATPLVVLQLVYFFRLHKKVREEMEEFVEAVHYRDFTRHFAWKHSPMEVRALRKGFNAINEAFKTISRERETQYQYLQKILELVDTGILCFETKTGQVIWMNESFRQLLGIPYLKNIRLLERRSKDLLGNLQEVKSGESKIVTLKKEDSPIKMLLTSAVFQTEGRLYKLVAFQNVNEALDETESLAWQKLLSVMTHEIMNSVAPIASLADTLKKRVQHTISHIPAGYEDGVLDDLELGIDTIKRRSEGLTKFAETYRNLSKIANLQLSEILVRDLFENLYLLMQPTLQQKNIEMEIVLRDTAMVLEADINLLEQVLINLVVNAMEAVKEKPAPCITLSAGYDNHRPVLSVADNGNGVPAALLDKIFIPFFSTRKNGNGIGLSLCKQIMMLHRGNIQVHTLEGKGTAFRLQF